MDAEVTIHSQTEGNNKSKLPSKKSAEGGQKFTPGKKVTVSEGLYRLFEKTEKTLKLKGREISFVDFSTAIETKITEKMLEEFIEANTPLDYRLKEASLDPAKREALEKFLRKLDKSSTASITED